MTKEEFEKYWLENMDMTAEQAEEMCFEAGPCDCGDKICLGWQMRLNSEKLVKRVKSRHLGGGH